MFTIEKRVSGNFYHIFNGQSSKVNLSDFEVVLDEADSTFIIQCKNGANIPYKPQPISQLQVVDLNIGTSPIPFSGVDGLRVLLTSINYTPYRNNSGGVGVQSVTGTTVDNTDPENPVVGVPNLPQVLTVGDKIFEQISASRNFELTDRTKYLLVYGNGTVTVTLNESSFFFPVNSVIEGFCQVDGRGSGATLDFGTSSVFYNTESVTEITLDVGDSFKLTNAAEGFWILAVFNKGVGSGASWGSITGTLSSQTDLQDALNDKQDSLGFTPENVSNKTTNISGVAGTYPDTPTVKSYVDTGLSGKQNSLGFTPERITEATTGAVVSFVNPQVYNSIASPSSSNITFDLTGARIGVVQKMYHNAGTAPTFPAGAVLRGTGTYATGVLNIIYLEWSVGTTVEYWITQ